MIQWHTFFDIYIYRCNQMRQITIIWMQCQAQIIMHSTCQHGVPNGNQIKSLQGKRLGIELSLELSSVWVWGHGNNRQKYTWSDATIFHFFLRINMAGSHMLEDLVFLNGWLFDAPIADGNNHKGSTATLCIFDAPIADGNNQLDGAPKLLNGDFLLLQLLMAATVKVDHMFLNAQWFDVPAVEGNNHTLSSSVPE